jgi:4-hydroxy-4-methyl-2-oxoglutarate aldolase
MKKLSIKKLLHNFLLKEDAMTTQDAALTINRNFKRAEDGLIKKFKNIPTGNVCDAQGRVGALDYRIKPITQSTVFAGVALTVNSGPRDNLAAWAAIDEAGPGDVIVIATDEYLGCSVLGDVYAGMAQNAGVVAIVTDGAVRDLPGIEQVGIPVFARGVCPNSPWKNGPGNIGLPIAIGGGIIAAGDILAGDQDGVVVVSRNKAAAVAENLKAVLAKEKQMDADVKAGKRIPAWMEEIKKDKGVCYID